MILLPRGRMGTRQSGSPSLLRAHLTWVYIGEAGGDLGRSNPPDCCRAHLDGQPKFPDDIPNLSMASCAGTEAVESVLNSFNTHYNGSR